jgi:predicted carbohydrate-binding protein with CBM5 and CBM33 domain
VSRPIVRRTAAVAVAGGLTVAAGLLPALPALAHGATTQPLSRTAACGVNGTETGSAACKAALKANGGSFGTFDNLRVPGVDGKDKQFIPDGKLCSGGLPEFKGLDLARSDWPVTKLTAGGKLSVQYRTTIPHEGSFRVYLTKPGYDPEQPLGWDDLGASPILTADNPPLRDGSYRMSGKLPADRSGRHVLFTIWQTTSTPDTYYSCSDLLLAAPKAAAVKPRSARAATGSAKPLSSRSPEPGAVAVPADSAGPVAGGGVPAVQDRYVTKAVDDDRVGLGRQIASAALIVLSGVTGAIGVIRIRRARAAQGIPRGPRIR